MAPLYGHLNAGSFNTNAVPGRYCNLMTLLKANDFCPIGSVHIDQEPNLAETSGVSIPHRPEGGYTTNRNRREHLRRADVGAIYYVTSAMQGSSGAPVFNDDWRAIALHQGGGEWSRAQSRFINNKGIRLFAISTGAVLGSDLSQFTIARMLLRTSDAMDHNRAPYQ
jgi:V8-like Glu-specific endopeptidase